MKRFSQFTISSLLLLLAIDAKAVAISLPPPSQSLPMNKLISLNPFDGSELKNIADNIFSITFDSTDLGLAYNNASGIGGSGRVATPPFRTQQEGIFNDPLAFPFSEYNYFSETVVNIAPQAQANDVPLPASLWMLLSSVTSILLMTPRKRFLSSYPNKPDNHNLSLNPTSLV